MQSDSKLMHSFSLEVIIYLEYLHKLLVQEVLLELSILKEKKLMKKKKKNLLAIMQMYNQKGSPEEKLKLFNIRSTR